MNPERMIESSRCFGSNTLIPPPARSGRGVVTLIILVILAYRLIPKPVRRLWSSGESTSHLALARFRAGQVTGWAAVRLFLWYAIPNFGVGDQWRYDRKYVDDGFGFSWRGFTGVMSPEKPSKEEMSWNR